MYAQEMGAIYTFSVLTTAEDRYLKLHGHYADSMRDFGPPENLLPREFALHGEGSGYRFTVSRTPAGFEIRADPVQFGVTGSRTFIMDQSYQLHQHYGPEPAGLGDRILE